MPKYHIWTIGCQMNKAESQHIASYMLKLGYTHTPVIKEADYVVVNTCVVRQNAEDKVIGLLGYLKGIKYLKPDIKVLVTGCFVDSNTDLLKNIYPHVDFFFKPGCFEDLFIWMGLTKKVNDTELEDLEICYSGSYCAFIPIIQGCNNFCSYCIVPYRRGREKSRTVEDIIREVTILIKNGVKEVTLLGQNVNSYGNDIGDGKGLSELLYELNKIEGLHRIRFLTNHPKDINVKLIEAIASLDKVCKYINLPLQAGNNTILEAMNRGYTSENYVKIVDTIRQNISEVSLSTDIIVGFPNETGKQFEETLEVIKKVRFDTVHVAMYSPRAGTQATTKYVDNVLPEEKKRRFYEIEGIQAEVSNDINNGLKDRTLDVLVEGKKKTKWYGRSESNKLVFFESSGEFLGEIVKVKINRTSPWALQGDVIS